MLRKTGNKGITLIALVISIIVLLILARNFYINVKSVIIGVLQRAADAKTQTGVGQEKEALSLAWSSCMVNKTTKNENITDVQLANELKNIGYNDVSVSKSGNKFKVTFSSGNVYTIKDDGAVQKYEKVEPTAVYAKLYTDGTLILSSTDYTDATRTIAENGDYGDVSPKNDYYQNTAGEPILLGDFPGWIDEHVYYPANSKIKKVIIYDKIAPTNTSYWFAGCNNLTEIEGIKNMDTSNVTNMSHMFEFCLALESLDLSDFDTCKVTDMTKMFATCIKLASLNISGFDTSEVVNMGRMIYECRLLRKIDVSSFNTSKVTDMWGMFQSDNSLLELDVSNFDTSNVIDMSYMFEGCGSLTVLDLSNFNTYKVTSFNKMFSNGNTTGITFNANVIIGPNWNTSMTESATGYNGTFETQN